MICKIALCPHYHGSAYVPLDLNMGKSAVICGKARGTIRASRCPGEENLTLSEALK